MEIHKVLIILVFIMSCFSLAGAGVYWIIQGIKLNHSEDEC